jgi:hypothetical protein
MHYQDQRDRAEAAREEMEIERDRYRFALEDARERFHEEWGQWP